MSCRSNFATAAVDAQSNTAKLTYMYEILVLFMENSDFSQLAFMPSFAMLR